MAMLAKNSKTEVAENASSRDGIVKSAIRQLDSKQKPKAFSGSGEQTSQVNGSRLLVELSQDDNIGKIFNASTNPALLAQYLRVYYANQRKGNAKTKTRGEVSGSGIKPWRQKGTGRARVGSIRNSAWRHGGVSHGPVPKDWSLNFPKKMSTKVMFLVLSQKLLAGRLYTVESLDLSESRTKELLSLLANWKLKGSILLVTEKTLPKLRLASANLKNVLTVTWSNLNVYQLLAQNNAIFEENALKKLEEKYAKSK